MPLTEGDGLNNVRTLCKGCYLLHAGMVLPRIDFGLHVYMQFVACQYALGGTLHAKPLRRREAGPFQGSL